MNVLCLEINKLSFNKCFFIECEKRVFVKITIYRIVYNGNSLHITWDNVIEYLKKGTIVLKVLNVVN